MRILLKSWAIELDKTPKLSNLGRQIIEVCLDNGKIDDYLNLIPMDYQYTIIPQNGEMQS